MRFVCLNVIVSGIILFGAASPVSAATLGLTNSLLGLLPSLVFEAESREESPQSVVTNVLFSFSFTNVSDRAITITNVRPSCGCTTLDLPKLPWSVEPGKSGVIRANVDVRGKQGRLSKSILVESSAPRKNLQMTINLPASRPAEAAGAFAVPLNEGVAVRADEGADRARNQQLATLDRQAVFKGDCAQCHFMPAQGKMGGELFVAACGVCHTSPNRASMVPDLFALNKPADPNYWRTWIMFGREGSLMPSFLKERGGPLGAEQIESLVLYLSTRPAMTTSRVATNLPSSLPVRKTSNLPLPPR